MKSAKLLKPFFFLCSGCAIKSGDAVEVDNRIRNICVAGLETWLGLGREKKEDVIDVFVTVVQQKFAAAAAAGGV